MGKRFFIGLCICVITKCVYGLPTATESSRTQNEDDDFDDEVRTPKTTYVRYVRYQYSPSQYCTAHHNILFLYMNV